MEERDAGGMREYDVAVRVEQLLRRDGALVVVDPVDVAGRDLSAAANLEIARSQVDVRGREPQPFALVVVLDREMVGHRSSTASSCR
jgi:hypothetical protein